jgi:homoserine O-acetyltransferase
MGGMQVLQWAASYPERLFSAVCVASAARHSAQNIAFHEVGRQAIMADPDWRGGDYALHGSRPEKGLAVARMAAHITYLSEAALQRKFGRELQRDGLSWGFDADFQVESYLRHQGATFVDRFDANSYLYITRAMDYFDLAAPYGGVLAEAFRKARDVRFCVLSFTSDWLYPTAESRHIVRALNAAGARASFVEIESDKGHDAFLLDEPVMDSALAGFLDSVDGARGLR